jgi:type IV pilus assembly protein PilC
MAKFSYKARDNSGSTTEGVIEAANKQQVFELLKSYNLLATRVIEQKEGGFNFKIPFLNRIPFKEKVIFSRQLATMIDSGLSIVQSLKILAEQERSKNKSFAEIIESLASDIESGLSLSAALRKFPNVFEPIYTSLVESGEASGQLDDVLNRIATQMEDDYDLRGKLKGAMTYPIFIVVVMFGAGVIVLTFVIPQLKSLFEESGADLPWVTRLLLAVSDFLVNFWYIALLGFVSLIFGFRYFLKSKKGRSIWDMFKIKIPVLGNFIKNIYMVRFTRTLSTLISAGLPILDSLKIVSNTIGNVHYKK